MLSGEARRDPLADARRIAVRPPAPRDPKPPQPRTRPRSGARLSGRTERRPWPPDGIGPDLPASVHWHAGRSCILFAFRRGAALVAVSMERLNSDGTRPDPRWRRTFGPRSGALFEAAPGDGPAPDLVLAEGEVDTLACRWLHRGARCLAAGGTAGPAARPCVVIEADGDLAGERAAATRQAI